MQSECHCMHGYETHSWLWGKAFKPSFVSLKEKEQLNKSNSDAAFTEPDVLYANKSHEQWKSDPSTRWYLIDTGLMFEKSVGNSHICMLSGRRKSSWGANGIISSLLNAMKVISRCISGIYLMSKTEGFEVIRAGFFFSAVQFSPVRPGIQKGSAPPNAILTFFSKSLFIGTQRAKNHWRFGNCVCCWSLSVLEVSSRLLPHRRGIFFGYDICFSPWEGFELTRLLMLRNPTALLTGPGGTAAYRHHGLCIAAHSL